jgi:Domain of unknown function (DUF4260)
MKMEAQSNIQTQNSGVVTGAPNIILRAEGALVFAAAVTAYSQWQTGWLLFALLILVPDIFMLGYLINRRTGSIGYNLGHTYLAPAALLTLGWFLAAPIMSAIALIWFAHIGVDRAVGYGLKYKTDFKHSHLGTIFSKNEMES